MVNVVAEESIHNVKTISVERPDFELITQEVELARGEVEQRADAGVRLTVVISEGPFEVTEKPRNAPIGAQQPVLGKGLVGLDLHCPVNTLRISEAVGNAVRSQAAGQRSAQTQRPRIEASSPWRDYVAETVCDGIQEYGLAHGGYVT